MVMLRLMVESMLYDNDVHDDVFNGLIMAIMMLIVLIRHMLFMLIMVIILI